MLQTNLLKLISITRRIVLKIFARELLVIMLAYLAKTDLNNMKDSFND